MTNNNNLSLLNMKNFLKSKISQIKSEFLGWPLVWCIVIITFDQITKVWAMNQNTDPRGVIQTVVPGYLNWAHHRNPGAAWGMFGEHTNILALVSLGAFLYILYEFAGLAGGKKSYRFFLSILMGGILGNWWDRQFRPEGVVDMIQVFIPAPQFAVDKWPQYMIEGRYMFPTFNIADSAICVAAGFFLIASFFESPNKEEKKADKT